MKKILAIAIALVMLLVAAVPAFAATATTTVPASKFTNNIALQDKYYAYYVDLLMKNATQFDVYTADAFYVLAGMINADANGFAGKTVSLKCDLIFNEGNAADWETTAPTYKWTAIDNFKGTFDGEGHTISGIYMSSGKVNYKGLFGVLKDGATVKNFAIVNSYFENDHEYGCGVIGRINAEGVTVRDIYADIIVKGDSNVGTGGIVGLVTNTGATVDKYAVIEGCVFAGTVKDEQKGDTTFSGYAGGIVGHAAQYQYNHCVIRDCLNIGTVIARRAAGAIIARGSTVTIERCVNLGTVESTDVQGAPAADGTPDPVYFDGALVGKVSIQPSSSGLGPGTPIAKINIADCYNLSTQITADYDYEVPATQTVTVITKDGVKGDAAKTVLTALDFAGIDATKTDWVTRANDVPMPKAIATMLAGVPNTAESECLGGHTQYTAEKFNASQHQIVCACGENIKYESHYWNNGEVTTPATHLATGVKKFTCIDCGEIKTETIPKTTAHAYGSWGKHNAEQHKKICACGDIKYESHNWNNGEVITSATHLATGVKKFTCIDCGEIKTETIPKTTAHAYGSWGKHNAEQHKKICVCGDIKYESHNWNNGEVTTSATHLTTGLKTFTCTDCGEIKTEIISKDTVAHDYHNNITYDKYNDQQHKKRCACGEYVLDWHNWNTGEITTKPTYTTEGVRTYTCYACGETNTETIEKLIAEPMEATKSPESNKINKAPETSGSSQNTANSGCSSNLGAGFGVIAVVMGIAVLAVSKKKRI